MTQYCTEYVEELEKQAANMVHVLQLQSEVNRKTGLVSPQVTADKVELAIKDYFVFSCDNSNN